MDTIIKQFSQSSYIMYLHTYNYIIVPVLEDIIIMMIKPKRYRLTGGNKLVIQIQHLNIMWTYCWHKHDIIICKHDPWNQYGAVYYSII